MPRPAPKRTLEQTGTGYKPASRAFAVSKQGRTKKGKGRRSSEGRRNSDRPQKTSRNPSEIQCYYCARKGHIQADCNFKKAADNLREQKNSGKKPAAVAASSTTTPTKESHAFMARRGFPDAHPGDWFVDSGATDHMCYEKDCFTVYHSLPSPHPIYLGNSSIVNAYGIGSVQIGDDVNLFNVLHVPDLDLNLLSVDKVLQHSYDVLFSGDGCNI
jgi:hypothetical protein